MFGLNRKDKMNEELNGNIQSNTAAEDFGFIPEKNKFQKPVWNPKSFVIISMLFSFFPAAILYSINYGRFGYPKKRNLYMILSFVLFEAVLVLVTLIPQTFMRALGMGINVGLGSYMMKDQVPLYKSHIDNGGKKASLVLPVMISLIVTGLSLWGYIYSINIPDTVLTFSGDELYYTQGIEKADAERIGKLLENEGFFKNDDHTISIKLDKSPDFYIVSLVVDKQHINDPDVLDGMKEFANFISEEAFNNSKVEVYLCDNRFNKIKSAESD